MRESAISRQLESRDGRGFTPYFHIRHYGKAAIYAAENGQKSREKAIHAGFMKMWHLLVAQVAVHPLVDELHSIENREDIRRQEIVDSFYRRRKTTLVL